MRHRQPEIPAPRAAWRPGAAEARDLLAALPGWRVDGETGKAVRLANQYEGACLRQMRWWPGYRIEGPPSGNVGYRDVRGALLDNAIGGLSENGFICAAKLEKLLVL